MKANGTSHLDAPRGRLYACLSDPRELEQLLPSVESVEQISEDELTVRVSPQTALGATSFDLELTIHEQREPEHVRLEGAGHEGEFNPSILGSQVDAVLQAAAERARALSGDRDR